MHAFNIEVEPESIPVKDISDLYCLINGTRPDISEEKITNVFKQSSFSAIVRMPSGQLLGWIRALSDGVSSTWIPELLVHPEFVSFGVESLLLEALLEKYNETTVYYQTFYDSFSSKVALFNKFGIKPLSNMVVCARLSS